MDNSLTTSKEYVEMVNDLKSRIQASQIKAALSVNAQLIAMYWELGEEIVKKQENLGWGSDFINQLSKDLSKTFPEMKGFSRRNLYYIRKWFLLLKDSPKKVQQLVAQIPWGHNVILTERVQDAQKIAWYIEQTIENGWSRNILSMQIQTKLYERQAQNEPAKLSNFSDTLPDAQSDLVHNTLKDPYIFDFLSVGKDAKEREIERDLVTHIRDFLLELGKGFAFVGNQYHLEVGGDDFYIDLLFYHINLRCYVVIELKAGKFKPEYSGKLNFYLSVVDDVMKHPDDNPTIGIILCQDNSTNKIVAEYSLKGMSQPIGVSHYELTEELPDDFREDLPTIAEFEKELSAASRKHKVLEDAE